MSGRERTFSFATEREGFNHVCSNDCTHVFGQGQVCCVCSHPPTGLEESIAELDFSRSACAAAQRGDASALRRMLARDAPFHLTSDGAGGTSGYTPLHYAARSGHAECAALLIEARAEVDARTSGGAAALHRAAVAGHERICAILLRAGADAMAQDSDGETPLHKAAMRGHVDVARTLHKVRRAAVAVAADGAGMTPPPPPAYRPLAARPPPPALATYLDIAFSRHTCRRRVQQRRRSRTEDRRSRATRRWLRAMARPSLGSSRRRPPMRFDDDAG